MDLSAAIDVFTHGFAAGKSRTHPYLVKRVGPLWVMEDAPRKDPRKLRKREIVVLAEQRPDAVIRRIQALGSGRHALCVVHGGAARDPEIEAAYKGRGYRCATHEPFFVRALPPVPRVPPTETIRVERVRDAGIARRVAREARSRQIDEKQLDADDPDTLLFAALRGQGGATRAVGWCASVRTNAHASWVQNLHVLAAYRRRGLGRALMKCMLRADAKRGIRDSVLLASQAGAKLYPLVGYEQIGTLQLFTPKRSTRTV